MIYIDQPGIVKWNAVQGSTFYRAFLVRWKDSHLPVDLTGWGAKLGGKRNINQTALDIDLNTTDGSIVLGGASGMVIITGDIATTRAWPVGDILMQFEFTEGAVTQTFLIGTIPVRKEIPV